MALTTNYSWDKPTVSGDVGAWGTKLNTIFDSIDSEVKLRQTEAAAALAAAVVAKAENLAVPNSVIHACEAAGLELNGGNFVLLGAIGLTIFASVTVPALYFAIRGLAVGLRITDIATYAARNLTGVNTIQAALVRIDNTGTETVVSAGHAITNGLGVDSTAAINHDVLVGNRYYIRVLMAGGGSGTGAIHSATATVTRP